MKNIRTLFVIIILFPHILFSQIKGTYEADMCDNISCFITITDTKYSIEFTETFDDQEIALLYSCGTYETSGSVVILNNTLHGDKVILNSVFDSITVIDAPLCLKNKTFKFLSEKTYDSGCCISTELFDKTIINTYSNSDSLYDFKETRYRIDCGLDLCIINNNEYDLFYNCLNLSSGKYEREGNSIIFYNDKNEEYFYALIDKDSIILKMLPGFESLDMIIVNKGF